MIFLILYLNNESDKSRIYAIGYNWYCGVLKKRIETIDLKPKLYGLRTFLDLKSI